MGSLVCLSLVGGLYFLQMFHYQKSNDMNGSVWQSLVISLVMKHLGGGETHNQAQKHQRPQ